MTAADEFTPDQFWHGHSYLAMRIGTLALQYRDIGCIRPACLSRSEWGDILTRIGEPLVTYAKHIDEEDYNHETEMAARESLRLFAEWFEFFWD